MMQGRWAFDLASTRNLLFDLSVYLSLPTCAHSCSSLHRCNWSNYDTPAWRMLHCSINPSFALLITRKTESRIRTTTSSSLFQMIKYLFPILLSDSAFVKYSNAPRLFLFLACCTPSWHITSGSFASALLVIFASVSDIVTSCRQNGYACNSCSWKSA